MSATDVSGMPRRFVTSAGSRFAARCIRAPATSGRRVSAVVISSAAGCGRGSSHIRAAGFVRRDSIGTGSQHSGEQPLLVGLRHGWIGEDAWGDPIAPLAEAPADDSHAPVRVDLVESDEPVLPPLVGNQLFVEFVHGFPFEIVVGKRAANYDGPATLPPEPRSGAHACTCVHAISRRVAVSALLSRVWRFRVRGCARDLQTRRGSGFGAARVGDLDEEPLGLSERIAQHHLVLAEPAAEAFDQRRQERRWRGRPRPGRAPGARPARRAA